MISAFSSCADTNFWRNLHFIRNIYWRRSFWAAKNKRKNWGGRCRGRHATYFTMFAIFDWFVLPGDGSGARFRRWLKGKGRSENWAQGLLGRKTIFCSCFPPVVHTLVSLAKVLPLKWKEIQILDGNMLEKSHFSGRRPHLVSISGRQSVTTSNEKHNSKMEKKCAFNDKWQFGMLEFSRRETLDFFSCRERKFHCI